MKKLESWLARQDWRRDGEGPCISLGTAGEFDDTHVFCPAVIFDGGRYRMYYCGSRGSDIQAHKYFAVGTAVWDGPG